MSQLDRSLAPRPQQGHAHHPLLTRLSELPGLETLSAKLGERLSHSGCETRTLSEQGRQLEGELEYRRKKFLAAKVVENGLKEIVLDHELRQADAQPQSAEEARAVTRLKEHLINAELSNYLPLLGGGRKEEVTLLGLTPNDLQQDKKAFHFPAESQAFVSQRLEELLFGQCVDLLDQLEKRKDNSAIATKEQYDKVITLPESIQAELETASLAGDEGHSRFRNEWRQLDAIVKNYSLMEGLAIRHRMGIRAEVDETNANYLSTKCKTLELKIRCLDLEILSATYRPAAISALKKIGQYLREQIAKTREDIAKTRDSLKQYEAVGASLESVVCDYAKVKTEIEGKKWALQELKDTV